MIKVDNFQNIFKNNQQVFFHKRLIESSDDLEKSKDLKELIDNSGKLRFT